MKDLSHKKRVSLIFDYMLFVQHNAAKMIKEGRNPTGYGLKDYLVEELNYTAEEAEEITKEVKQFIKIKEYGKSENKDS